MSGSVVRWLYLDMNSYFASVEQEMNPALRGKPVAVVPMKVDTTSCIAVSYEGKAFGVKTGTRVGEAKRLCPKMIFVIGDHSHYIRTHHQIIAAVESCVPIDSVRSIDEIACRLTGSQQNLEEARRLAQKIKSVIRERVGETLKCSIGLAPNRYVAKIAADMKKPDGLTVLTQAELPQALFGLALRDLPGVGPKTEERLHRKRIYSIEQLCQMAPAELRGAWGSVFGEEISHLLRGTEIGHRAEAQKSIGHSQVLSPDIRYAGGAFKILKKLTAKTAQRLRRSGLWATGIEVSVSYLGQEAWNSRRKIFETQDTLALIKIASEMWEGVLEGTIYGVGISLHGLVPDERHTPTLFEDPRLDAITRTLDRVNERFGKGAIHYGAVHEGGEAELAPLRIAFTRIPELDEP